MNDGNRNPNFKHGTSIDRNIIAIQEIKYAKSVEQK